MYVLSWIFFGAFTGWIAGLIVNKRGEGCILNTALGLVGGWAVSVPPAHGLSL